jgi:hypothetical protein
MQQTTPLSLCLAALLALAAPAQASDNCKAAAPSDLARFIVKADQPDRVLDSRSGLVWKRCSEGQEFKDGRCEGDAAMMRWRDALEVGTDADTVKAGWRLPTIAELETLVTTGCDWPSVDLGIFPDTPNKAYWSSTQVPEHAVHAFYVHVGYGGTRLPGGITRDFALRLVR